MAKSRTAQMRWRLRRAGQNKSSPDVASPGLSWLAVVIAFVLTESRVEITVVEDTVMVAGLKLQAAFVGRPEHANVTAPANPATPVTLIGALTI
jgi:hypothetical protein